MDNCIPLIDGSVSLILNIFTFLSKFCLHLPLVTMAAVSVANGNFTLALFKKITEKNKTGNVLYSPLSISAALAMVLLGARANTATQLSEVSPCNPF